ncbi:MAG: Protein GrpE [Candidatus Magasanikbacteria bacterium GW2011_GWA2_46_17]|uniref:Protein GrpE n=2 Tax=Parcubacteria group TaxID=1794811 RepID=A0A0G1P2R4_9BACT|nr:MAG: Protein GrpE [Candidatus Magasanikbacteria bacterium GW2011_GWA2_46_17]OGG60985.1 MAG: nucleotide exchange factor GrpE [Candidatus Kaiserbacteria bacterium RIFCSPHIGHO2_02_FULL_49_16]
MIFGKKDKKESDLEADPEEVKISPDEEVVEIEDEEKGDESLADKLKKLRTELEKCKEEKQEYLIGWQRCKADSINSRKDAILAGERAGNRARNTLIEDIIPALDSFDMAIASDTWAKMDANWRIGMENVRSQLVTALSNQGVSGYAEVGDAFDPTQHEAVQEIDAEGEPGSIAKILRRGYMYAGNIIRPAHVAVIVHKE